MKPLKKLAAAQTPDGGEMVLYQHDHDFMIQVNGRGLMNSRQHELEMELARTRLRTSIRSPRTLRADWWPGHGLYPAADAGYARP